MSEVTLKPCPACKSPAGRATKRATTFLKFIGLWKVSCQKYNCPLSMIYFNPAEWNELPRISSQEYTALKAEIEHLRKDSKRYHWLRTNEDFQAWLDDHLISNTTTLKEQDEIIDAAMQRGNKP